MHKDKNDWSTRSNEGELGPDVNMEKVWGEFLKNEAVPLLELFPVPFAFPNTKVGGEDEENSPCGDDFAPTPFDECTELYSDFDSYLDETTLADMDEYIRGAEGFKTQLVKVARKNKELEAEVASLEKQLESETQSVLQELQEKQRLLELEEKERQLQNIPQEIIDRYNSVHTNSKKMEDIAYE
jgi:hypothetical protein